MFGKGQQDGLVGELTALRGRVAELEAERARGLRLDGVTGVLSASALRGRLSEEVERARRYQRPLSVAVVSIDDFAAFELPARPGSPVNRRRRRRSGLAVHSRPSKCQAVEITRV